MEDVKVREMQIFDYKKKIAEAETKLKQQQVRFNLCYLYYYGNPVQEASIGEKNPLLRRINTSFVSFIMRKFANLTLRPTAIAAEVNVCVHKGRSVIGIHSQWDPHTVFAMTTL